jgi:hypothetical protein
VPGTQLKIAIANCLQSLAGAFKQFIPKLGRDQSSRHGFAEIDGLHVRFIPSSVISAEPFQYPQMVR